MHAIEVAHSAIESDFSRGNSVPSWRCRARKLQKLGLFDARIVPAKEVDASNGKPWVQVPHHEHVHPEAISKVADRCINELNIFDIKTVFVDGLPSWNVDPKTGADIGQEFGLSIDFRHIAGGVDIKYLWEG